ncbi:structural maintenance of chromosomes flexible hinge domain-containing protein GMI1 [Lactuca sativa]|uniref:structural maintenance of chromosomes flexible hinge domain-containing protein GMI1 n=1 Tax=Lactuca sativa TaxID=4236 RepID=UPI000CD85531|nr:structural maintenance of chromosomes flexible hinge domain-containing protein GMI1 [Lactuca sativa]
MDGDRHLLTPQKRLNETSDVERFKRRTPDSLGVISQDVSGPRRVYKLKILLPNGITVLLKIPEGTERISVEELAGRVRNEYAKAVQKTSSPKKQVNWNTQLCFLDDSDHVFRNSLTLTKLEPNRVYNLRLHDGSQPAKIYENMWDLTPDTELLKELPEEYTFETALADIIDNSLQAVWSNGEQEKRLISVEVSDDRISIIDTGPGMDSLSIEKWGKMGASLHRASKGQAIGGKPPYLKPAFGMFGYGGFVASMHLGRHTEVSSKTKDSKKVYMLRLEREALVSGSGSKRTWRTYGSLRDPMKDELQLAPGGSFTKIDIFEPKKKNIDIRQLKCKLKDIYFPYIQCDELSKKGRTIMPIEFQVNGDNLAEIPGGEVAITNLNTCNGPEFVLQLRFQLNHDNDTITSSPGARSSEEANARLKCYYLPVKEGKESIQNILETLKEEGYGYTEDFGSFSHVSCRRLGRLLPDARWAWLPFMDFRQRPGHRTQVLKRSCMRVKCFIETDAGFNPTPSKTDFAHQNPFANALKTLGTKQPPEKEIGVHIDIRRDGKPLTLLQLDKQYQQWLVQMHEKYDEEVDCGIDEPVFIVKFSNKELNIANNVVRVHKAVMRKGKSWDSGQKIKILKGACAGFHKTNIYATLEYIILEGFQGDAGEAWIICRRIEVSEEDGCLLESANGNPTFDLRKSELVPINVIDSGKCLAVDGSEWDNQLKKQYQKCPSSIQILNRRQSLKLGIDSSLPDADKVHASHVSPCDIVAVIRPATYKSGIACEELDQKYVMKDNFEMSLSVTFSENGNGNESNIYSGRVTPSSRKDLHGLYIFQPKCNSHPLFQKAGIYKFTFSIRDSSCEKRVVKVKVEASREVHKWALAKKLPDYNVTVGRCFQPIFVAMFDAYSNQIPFLKVPEVVVKVECNKGVNLKVHKWSPSISSDMSPLILKDLVIGSSNLDNIRPSYDATLMLCRPDGSHMLEIPIKVFPGSLTRVTVQPENFEKQLIPGHTIKELTLELFDAFGNHLREKEKVQLSMNGFTSLEKSFSSKKVDADGCVDLGGLLKVTAGYGKKVSLSVGSDGQPVIMKEWQIEERQLRTVSMIPETCFAGSYLENLEFEVVDSKGDVDVNFHDEDTSGQSHTLVIKSQSHNVDESVKYGFREGRCIVRAVPVPSEIVGDFSFVVAHACHPDLKLTIKVHVEMPPLIEPLNAKHLSPDETIFPLMDSNNPTPTPTDCTSVQHIYADGIETELESILVFQRDLENELIDFGMRIGKHEENIKLLEYQQRGIESQLLELNVSRYHYQSCSSTRKYKYGSPGKDEITEKIECKTETAAAVVIKLFKMMSEMQDEEDCFGTLMGRIIGVVALVGTAPTLNLSRIFAEYLGDEMLAVVCKSYEHVILLETYEENGKVNRAHALHMFASELGQSINGRYGVICIEDIRACEAEKDVEGKLLLPDPTLPDGTTPKGFLGYAVNMIDIDVDYLNTRTESGYGLRETLFYRLFGETQVYETREDMRRAISSIKDGAVSLDGGILRGNGVMSLGGWEGEGKGDIIFPVAVGAMRNEAASPRVMKRYNELKLKLKRTVEELVTENKSLEKLKKKYKKRRDVYANYFTRNQPIITTTTDVSPISSCLEEKPVVVVPGSYTPFS